MREEPLPCPFCSGLLIKKHIKYRTWKNIDTEYNYYEHPQNECVLADRICEHDAIMETDIDKWNRRIKPYSLFETVQNPKEGIT